MTGNSTKISSPKPDNTESRPDTDTLGNAVPGRGVFGIKAKLFLAVCALAGLTAIASAVAWYVSAQIDRAVSHITTKSVPGMVASLRLAEKSAEIAATAPTILASTTQVERALAQAKLEQTARDLVRLTELLNTSVPSGRMSVDLIAIEKRITAELRTLNEAVDKRLRVKAQREAGVVGLSRKHTAFLETLEPLIDDAIFGLVVTGEEVTTRSAKAITGLVEGGVGTIHRLLTIKSEGNLAAGLLAETAHLDDPTRIQPMHERFNASASAIERNLRALPEGPDKAKLQSASATLLALGQEPGSIFEVRERELQALAEARVLLQVKRKAMTASLKTAHDALLATLTPMVDDVTFDLILRSDPCERKDDDGKHQGDYRSGRRWCKRGALTAGDTRGRKPCGGPSQPSGGRDRYDQNSTAS